MKKLIPAIVMLLVSAVVLSTASYAWFTVSTNVTADGMQVTASAPTSILISQVEKSATATGKLGYSYLGWSSSITFTQDATKLYAASSADGVNFVTADECEDLTGGAKLNTGFSTATNVTGGTAYYVDYTFAVKNTSPDAGVVLEVGSITLGGYALKDAVRVAIFVDEEFVDDSNVSNGILYNPGSASVGYVKNGGGGVQAQGPIAAPITAGADSWATDVVGTPAANVYKAITTDIVTLEASTQDVETDAEGNEISSTAVDNAHIITVRIWFEGQSAACISNYAGQNVTIAMQFVKGTADN